jgi:hypothetical protein
MIVKVFTIVIVSDAEIAHWMRFGTLKDKVDGLDIGLTGFASQSYLGLLSSTAST